VVALFADLGHLPGATAGAERPGVVRLAAAGGVERRPVQRDGVALDGDHAAIELFEIGIGLVQ
jgi:hypothetical protein